MSLYTTAKYGTRTCLVLFCLCGLTACTWAPWNWGASVQKGKATWYGNEYHGRKTASGEVFDQWAMTAAHKKLPFGTIVEVKNLKNNKKVKVRINDRGPFVRDRIIDLSRAAAEKIDLVRLGVAPVRVEVLRRGG